MFSFSLSPWYNCNGWLGVKHQVTYNGLFCRLDLNKYLRIHWPPKTVSVIFVCVFLFSMVYVAHTDMYVSGCVGVCNIPFLYLQYICLYHTCVLKSEFGHVWFLATLVYLLKFLYVNSCMVGGRIRPKLFIKLLFFYILSIVCVYTFFCSFLYGALCPRACYGSCAIEMSIIIIIIIIKKTNNNKTLTYTYKFKHSHKHNFF